MKNISIRVKLILLFILIKIIPLFIVIFIAYEGIISLERYLNDNRKNLFNENKEIILNTANKSIEDSIKYLDKKTQLSLERLSFEIANKVADFLYERDKDLLFLSKIDINQEILKNFYDVKNRDIILQEEYIYDDKNKKWTPKNKRQKIQREVTTATLKDNEKNFNYTDPIELKKKSIPIYKEVVYFDINGNEQYKVSSISNKLKNISNKKNTYINSENYFKEIQVLKKGEIYVSDVIGEYVGTKIIGPFTKEKAKKINIAFDPEKYAHAGKENPVGKEFEGIIRFITPVFKNGIKKGYISFALDHKHIMQFTDTSNPTSNYAIQTLPDPKNGNYAFMWDYEGKNISHVRDYFISGFDRNTGKRVIPWLSKDVAIKFENSKKDINEFLSTYPKFEEQSLQKKPNIKQLLEEGKVALDCRYLNFAPQCEGWMQVTKNGGYGSFVIFWSNVWKLTTAAAIPYYTGKYADSKRGFGFITIGANVEEFHAPANETKRSVTKILEEQTKNLKEVLAKNKFEVTSFIDSLIHELSIVTLIMIVLIIFISIFISKYITSKIEYILQGTKRSINNDILDISKIKTDLYFISEHVVELFSKKASEKHLKLIFNIDHKIPLCILTDGIRLRQVLSNLLSNAIKFTHEGKVSLNITLLEEKDNRCKIRFEIEDSGIGIPQEKLENLLKPFDQVDHKVNRQYEETRLGLSNCFHIIQALGSKMNTQSEKNVGSKFFFDLETKSCDDNLHISKSFLNHLKFKVTKEDSDLYHYIKRYLGLFGKETKEDEKPDIVICSCDKIKEQLNTMRDKYKHIPILILFEYEDEVKDFKLRENEHTLVLPFYASKVNDALKELLRKTKQIKKTSKEEIKYEAKVLVAEDNETNQELISNILDSMNIKYSIQGNGLKVLNEYKQNSYDLILMDINMPVLDGVESFKEIRKYEEENFLKQIPIIALTANAIKEDKERFLSLEMNEYLSKPINIDELKKVFNKYLKKR
ncbi:hypothetical protein CRV01_08715 [Arcobacter sp. CECT 8983]|uniref:response regulator n=1 Tax=Arcobacter sp. CECT 8983 TaxID=2044508 RepID=UPI00100BFA96|nr:response regulator [Arcobacter sp. CECT 8983]RXJ88701.1 hypothetical protein CRV01_08715 [Arcobacter sp. CECT 8983]